MAACFSTGQRIVTVPPVRRLFQYPSTGRENCNCKQADFSTLQLCNERRTQFQYPSTGRENCNRKGSRCVSTLQRVERIVTQARRGIRYPSTGRFSTLQRVERIVTNNADIHCRQYPSTGRENCNPVDRFLYFVFSTLQRVERIVTNIRRGEYGSSCNRRLQSASVSVPFNGSREL